MDNSLEMGKHRNQETKKLRKTELKQQVSVRTETIELVQYI